MVRHRQYPSSMLISVRKMSSPSVPYVLIRVTVLVKRHTS